LDLSCSVGEQVLQQSEGSTVGVDGHPDGRVVQGGEKRQALDVIPMDVGEEKMMVGWLVAQLPAEGANSRAGIYDNARFTRLYFDARRVAAVL
jgi:hypothetical protein